MPALTHNRRCRPRPQFGRMLAAKFAGIVVPLSTVARPGQGVECRAMFSNGIDGGSKLCWASFGRDDP